MLKEHIIQYKIKELLNASKQEIGIVISNKMQKTIVVKIENRYPHPIYSKTLVKTKKYLAHDELEEMQYWRSKFY